MKKLLLILLLPLTLFGQSQKISDMTSATTLSGTELVPIVQTTNKKATVSLLRGFGSYGTAGQYMTVNGSANGFTFVTPPFISAYPGAGIAVSTGSAWGTSITDNSANWNTAFGWGNHASAGYLSDTTDFIKTQGTSILTDDIIVDADTMDISIYSDGGFGFNSTYQPDGIHEWGLGFNQQLYSYPQAGPGTEVLQIMSYRIGIFDAGGADYAIDIRPSPATWRNKIPSGYAYSIVGSGYENMFSVDSFLGNIDIGNSGTTLTLSNIPAASGQTYAVVVDDTGLVSSQAIGGGGDVTKVGTPADNQIGVWTGDGTIEGTSGLTYNGSNLQLTGDIGSTGTRITKGWFTDLQVTNAIAGSITGNAATVTTNANLTGHITSTGNAAVLGSFTTAQLNTAISDGDVLTAEVDGSITNEGSLTVSAGSGTTSIIDSNTSGSTGVTLTAGTGLSISEVGNVITLANTGIITEVDGSTSNELQTITNSSDATSHTVTLSNSGGTVQLIEGSNITLTTGGTGSAGTVTIASTGGGGGITNGAAANELMKSDGTNAVASGAFSTTAGDITLGTSLTGAARTITADGSATDVDINLVPKGSGGQTTLAANASGAVLILGRSATDTHTTANIAVEGTQTNISIGLLAKNAGSINLSASGGDVRAISTSAFIASNTSGIVMGESSTTGTTRTITTNGTGADVDIVLTPKGAGNVKLGTLNFNGDQTVGAGQDNYVLTYDNGTGLINLEAAPGGGSGLTYAQVKAMKFK